MRQRHKESGHIPKLSPFPPESVCPGSGLGGLPSLPGSLPASGESQLSACALSVLLADAGFKKLILNNSGFLHAFYLSEWKETLKEKRKVALK